MKVFFLHFDYLWKMFKKHPILQHKTSKLLTWQSTILLCYILQIAPQTSINRLYFRTFFSNEAVMDENLEFDDLWLMKTVQFQKILSPVNSFDSTISELEKTRKKWAKFSQKLQNFGLFILNRFASANFIANLNLASFC